VATLIVLIGLVPQYGPHPTPASTGTRHLCLPGAYGADPAQRDPHADVYRHTNAPAPTESSTTTVTVQAPAPPSPPDQPTRNSVDDAYLGQGHTAHDAAAEVLSENQTLTPENAGTIVGASIKAYCPQYSNQ
jgi:hypothetical protein